MIPRITSRQMVTRLCIIISLATALSATHPSKAQEVLTNQAVVDMVKAHLPEGVILEQIRSNKANFVLNSSDLIKLKQQGVPDAIISAMQAKRPAVRADAPDPNGQAALPSTGINAEIGQWNPSDYKDNLDGHVKSVVTTSLRGTPAGNFDVDAYCEDDSGIAFYIYNQSRGLTLKRSQMQQTGNAPEFCVEMRFSLDGAKAVSQVSQWCGDDNYSALVFYGNLRNRIMAEGQQMGNALRMAGPDGPNSKGAAVVGLIESFRSTMMAQGAEAAQNMAAAAGIPRMSDVVKAQSLRVELPLTNGTRSVIEMNLQQPAFQKYVSTKCRPPAGALPTTTSSKPVHPPPIAPGHHLSDTYQRTIEITKENEKNGIQDVFSSPSFNAYFAFLYHPCKSPTEGGQDLNSPTWRCDPTSETIRASGDLVVPPAFWDLNGIESYRHVCEVQRTSGQRAWVIPVGLAGQPSDKRYLVSCQTIFGLASRRQQVASRAELGSPDTEPAVGAPTKIADSFRYLSGVPLASREYEGTPESFGKELIGFIDRAASAGGLPPRNYQQEVAFISNVVQTCKQITPQMESSVKGWIGQLGTQYRACSSIQYVSRQLRTVSSSERGITLWVHPLGGRWGQGFTADVSFDQLNGDSPINPIVNDGVYDHKTVVDERWSRYGIVRATLRQF